jgi:hypothetical protein
MFITFRRVVIVVLNVVIVVLNVVVIVVLNVVGGVVLNVVGGVAAVRSVVINERKLNVVWLILLRGV